MDPLNPISPGFLKSVQHESIYDVIFYIQLRFNGKSKPLPFSVGGKIEMLITKMG